VRDPFMFYVLGRASQDGADCNKSVRGVDVDVILNAIALPGRLTLPPTAYRL